MLSQPVGLQKQDVDAYVADLADYLKSVHKHVDAEHGRIRDNMKSASYRVNSPHQGISVGDYCLVRRAPEPGVSRRFQNPHFEAVFQIAEVHGDGQDTKAFTLSDLFGNREGLGFVQPIAYDRLTYVPGF